MRFLSALSAWCVRASLYLLGVGLLVGVRAVYLLAEPQQPVAVQDTTQLWAQLLTAGVVLAVGTAVIGMFFRFKDAATQQAEKDRAAGAKAIQDAKEALLERTDADKDILARDLSKIGSEVTELTHALKGVAGYGGLLNAIIVAERRRHDLNNQLTVMLGLMAEMARALGEVTGRLGVPFNQKDVQEDIADVRKKNDALRNGER